MNDWKDPSVLKFARGDDPVKRMESVARRTVLAAVEQGWEGPPFDPIELAKIRGISVRPNAALSEARVFWTDKQFQIEYNPHRPRGRMNFSIAHEIAHTFFDDCARQIRHRSRKKWDDPRPQLEQLCNIGAAELTMPVGSFPSDEDTAVTIEELMRLRKHYQVSAEAILIRLVKLTPSSMACFSATRFQNKDRETTYRIDYDIESSLWSQNAQPKLPRRLVSKTLDKCVAIGTTSQGVERLEKRGSQVSIEAVALPPIPGTNELRIAGFVRPKKEAPDMRGIAYRQGDASTFLSDSNCAILHIVNDSAVRWVNRGFAAALRRAHPIAYTDYASWSAKSHNERRLGAVHFADLTNNNYVVSLVAQKGYGPSTSPRIRYEALDRALTQASEQLQKINVSLVQMPRFGTGQARGNWEVIEGLIRERLMSTGIEVRVVDLPPR